ncbi:hypothetical protein IM700_014250 [Paenibacillus sp. DXFW5]|uniref:Big-1 domain-containing protein n=1 Tax=Paenibacillus rhizolycopersici TaxID=2780073 RepID=A0ABS2HB65_9BACL|nr:hypothetical protein [Paenibacillus rhizolycopersici]MBM6996814.1 hypothetical protein [Paenibacillus rhizolycopersici]
MPNYYAQIDEDGRVYAVSELAGEVEAPNLIPVSEQQYRSGNLLFTRYAEGSFTGNFARMEADKTQIQGNGEDTVTVKITVVDWQGQVQKEFNGEVAVELNGIRQSVKAAKGVAEVTISSDEPGAYALKTVDLDRNGDIKVVVVDGN